MRKLKGEITVFLSLMLVVLISILFTVIEAARTNAVQFQTECAADMAVQSVLAEYNRELLEQYDLFFIDIGYGTEEAGYILLEQHLQDYMDGNFRIEQGILSMGLSDLLQLSADAAVILQAAGAADGDGAVLERKAVDYMLDRYGLADLSKISTASGTVREKGLLENTMEQMREKNERAIDAVDTTVEKEDGEKKKIPVNNPADTVNSRRKSSVILSLVTQGNPVSDQAVCTEAYLSHRGYNERDGFLLGEGSVSAAEDLLFQKFLMEKCGKYTETKEGSCLDYQVEYILAGKGSDRENLQSVVNRLLVLRETANFAYLMSDSGKQAEAEALAMTLAAVTLFPELKDLIKLSILIAWAYAESVNDVTLLLEGGKVPIWKDAASWHLSLESAMKLKTEHMEKDSGQGLTYEEYLQILLLMMDKDDRNMRFMDIVEMDIRQTGGNENFCMDHCIHAFTAEMTVSSAKGHSCLITRTAGYEK